MDRFDTVRFCDLLDFERKMMKAGGIISASKRVNGEFIYFDEYEFLLNESTGKSLADIIDMHSEKEISDDEFNKKVWAHEYAELLRRRKQDGR